VYKKTDHFAHAVHPLGNEPFKAVLELCEYLKRNVREDRCPEYWSTFPNEIFEECVFEGTESELFKYVETLNLWAEPYRGFDRPAIFILRVIPIRKRNNGILTPICPL
jgi:hypothetical protein